MEFLLQLLFELVVQIVGQILIELGLHSLFEPFRKSPNPWVAAIGYVIFGAIFGGLSLFLFPEHVVRTPVFRWVNLVITPLAAGLCMYCLGIWRARRGQQLLRIDRFSYGYLFALVFAVVRQFWAH